MRADDLDHKELLELNPEGGVIRFAEQRALLLDAVATEGGGAVITRRQRQLAGAHRSELR
jgi:hypothetical protein